MDECLRVSKSGLVCERVGGGESVDVIRLI